MTLNIRNAVLGLLLLSALASSVGLLVRTVNEYLHPSMSPLHGLTEQFTGLKRAFAHVPRAGYYTDKNMEHPLAIAEFEQAQYVLAPTVLELNNTSLPLTIFDCTRPEICIAKIKELKLVPISASSTGLILAANPQGQHP